MLCPSGISSFGPIRDLSIRLVSRQSGLLSHASQEIPNGLLLLPVIEGAHGRPKLARGTVACRGSDHNRSAHARSGLADPCLRCHRPEHGLFSHDCGSRLPAVAKSCRIGGQSYCAPCSGRFPPPLSDDMLRRGQLCGQARFRLDAAICAGFAPNRLVQRATRRDRSYRAGAP